MSCDGRQIKVVGFANVRKYQTDPIEVIIQTKSFSSNEGIYTAKKIIYLRSHNDQKNGQYGEEESLDCVCQMTHEVRKEKKYSRQKEVQRKISNYATHEISAQPVHVCTPLFRQHRPFLWKCKDSHEHREETPEKGYEKHQAHLASK